jgi:hypothetical protein
MTVPHYINEHQSDIRAIKPGWYGVENNGKLSSGPYPNHGECLTGITQARGNFRASPWLARATARSDFEHRPGCGPSSVPSAEASTSGRARG